MKNIYIFALLICITSCTSNTETGEEQLSLNGNWKFYAIYGEGSNYMNIQETNSDIVIDNNAPNVEVKGDWKTLKTGVRNSKFYGEDICNTISP